MITDAFKIIPAEYAPIEPDDAPTGEWGLFLRDGDESDWLYDDDSLTEAQAEQLVAWTVSRGWSCYDDIDHEALGAEAQRIVKA